MKISSSLKKSFFDYLGIKNNWVVLFSLFFFFVIFSNSTIGQTTLYSENFSTNTGKGHIGTSLDTTGVGSSWTINSTNFITPVSGEYFKVLAGVFESYNTDATQASPMFWYTRSVSITGYSNVTLSVDLTSVSSNSLSGVEAFYSIDGGTYISFGSLINSTGTNLLGSTATISGLSGSTVRIRVNHWGSSSTPYYRHDNVSVVGFVPVNYYSKSNGNLDNRLNWGTNTDGSGTAPIDFTAAAQTFNIRNNATPTIGAGWTVSGTSSKIVVGDGTSSSNFTIPASYAVTGTIDVANNATLSIAHLTTNPTLGTLASGSTVDYIGAGNQTIANGSYHHLKLSTSGTKTLIAGVTSIGGNLTTSGTATTTTVVGLTIGGNLIVGDGTTFTAASFALTINGTTTIGTGTSGNLTVSSATGAKTFIGLVTVSSLGTWNNSGNSDITFKGGITKSGTFTAGTGIHTFSTNSQSVTGALTIPKVTITSVILTCNSSSDLTVNTALILNATAILNMTSSQLLGTLTTLTNGGVIKTSNTGTTPLPTAKAWGGTIEYGASGAQNIISATSYTNITVSGSGNKTMDASIILPASGVLTLSGSAVIVPGAYVLQSDNTTAGAIVGGSSSSYISGALKRKIATGTNTGDWNFPVGIGGSYYPFVLKNPNQATGYTSVSVTASSSGGSAGTCNASISTSEYWTVVTTTNLSAGLVSLGKPAIGSLNTISQSPSTTLASAYVSRYGTLSGNSVINSNTVVVNNTTSYFVLSTASSTAPSISTPTSASVSTSTVTLGGNLTSIGCSNVSERGIYYSTTNVFADGAGTKVSVTAGPYAAGVFTLPLTGLVPSTVYYYKAFATNLAGTVYTTQGTFTTTAQSFPVTEGFESDASGSFAAGSSTTLGSKIETGSWTNNYATGGCGSYYLRLTNGVSNQWYFTPLFYATSGKIYTVSYKGSNTASSASVNIYLATAQSSASANLSTDYFTGSGSTSIFATETAQGWLCTSTGLYSFGFKVSSGGSALGLDCISISETTPSTITWTGNSNTTNWSTSGNWDLARVPSSSDIIVIPSGKSYYPASVPAGSYNSLTLNNGTLGGTTTINACTFAGALTILSSSAGNTVTIAGTTTVGGNISIGGSGSAFTFNCNASVTGMGSLVLGNNITGLTSNFNYPISVTGALTLGTNASSVTNISYSTTTGAVAAIRASNSGSFVFYGAVNYTATSGDQIVMKSQYNGPVTASGSGSRFMEGDLDINDNLTISGGKWYCGNTTERGSSGTLGTDSNAKEAISPYKGAANNGKYQMIFKSSFVASSGISSSDLLTSLSYFVLTKGSTNAYKNFTIKLGLTTNNSFVGASATGFTYLTPTTTVFTSKDVTTVANAWNTHTFDTPFAWDGSSNILVEITFDNSGFSGPSGTDLVAYYEGVYSDDIIAYNSSFSCGSIYCPTYNGVTMTSNSNYMGKTIFNIADGPYNINITNNWLNSGGTFYHLTNTVTFDGSTNQNVTTRGDNFYNYTVNNAYATTALTLLDDNNVEGTATLTDGVISTGSNKLIILSSTASKLTGYSNASFVKGNLRRYIGTNTSTYGFPLGKGTSTTDYFLSDIINNNLTTTSYLDGKFVSGTPADYTQASFMSLGKLLTGVGIATKDITSLDSKGYTQIDPNVQPGGGSYSFKMYSANYTTSKWMDNNQCIMKRSSSSVTLNDFNQAGTVNADNGLGRKVSDGYLLSTGLSSFSIFEPGLVTVVGLSVQLLDFNAVLRADKVYLDWSTQSEKNNDYFTIEKSQDGYTFFPLMQVKGYVNSQTLKAYQEIDNHPNVGVTYYRLKQTDTDGKISYSQIRTVIYNLSGIAVFPNPAIDNHFQIEFNSEVNENVDVLIYNNLGQLIFQSSFTALKGINNHSIQLNHTAKGLYQLHIIGDNLGDFIQKIEF